MCWRDDVVTERYCSDCGQTYYGDLGHRGCPARLQPQVDPLKERIIAVGERHGWDEKITREKITRVREILVLERDIDAINFLLEVMPNPHCDIIDKLDEEHPPF